MAVVPDRRIGITHKLKMLRTNKAIVTAALEKILSSKTTHDQDNNKTSAGELSKNASESEKTQQVSVKCHCTYI